MKIMDFEARRHDHLLRLPVTLRIEQRGNNAWIVKLDDVKAVVKGVSASDLTIDFDERVITMSADPLA